MICGVSCSIFAVMTENTSPCVLIKRGPYKEATPTYLDEIAYMKCSSSYTHIYFADETEGASMETHHLKHYVDQYVQMGAQFIYISRDCAVNRAHIASFHKGKLRLKDNRILDITSRRRKFVQEQAKKYTCPYPEPDKNKDLSEGDEAS